MASKGSHFALAKHNESLIQFLVIEGKLEDYPDWIATVAFYAAIHYVEGLFASEPTPVHSHNHEARESTLKNTNRYKKIYKPYRKLEAISKVARYLLYDGGKYKKFSEYMSPEKVQNELINHYLNEIKKSVKKLSAYDLEKE